MLTAYTHQKKNTKKKTPKKSATILVCLVRQIFSNSVVCIEMIIINLTDSRQYSASVRGGCGGGGAVLAH